jgi:hypothetical protein
MLGSPGSGPGTYVPGQTPGSGLGPLPGGGAPGSGGGVAGGRVPGLTAKEIYVGAFFQQDQATANAGIFGAGNLDSGDARDYFNAVIGEINAAGGLAGRRIVPLFAELRATSNEPIDEQYQAACETWIRDSRYGVFAIADSGTPVVQECARKAGVAVFGEQSGSVPETFRRYTNYVEISGIDYVRQGFVTVDGLEREGYFGRGAKIGIVTWDDSFHRTAVTDGYVPALRRHGLSLGIETAYARVPESVQDIGRTSVDISGAVLRFSDQNVTHVLLLDGQAGVCAPGCLSTIFMREAESQLYHPRYGLNTQNEPVAGLEGGIYPPSQLRRSVAVIWRGADKAADAGISPNAARARCFALMKKKGITLNNPNAELSALSACGSIWFMQAAFGRMAGAVTVANFMGGVNRLGGAFNDPFAYGTFFGPTQHDGVAAVRNARFDESCTCFRYTTGAYRV